VLNGRFVGELVVTPDPSYEIAEVWNDTIGLLVMVSLFFLVINLSVYVLVKYTFRPVDRIKNALAQIELGHLKTRLPDFKQIELHEIGQKFNLMAETLQKSTQNNHNLTQQIIRLQEDERKHLARDIHDEIGQYLTAINMDASAIVNGRKLSSAKESARAISSVTRQMMDVVHHILQRLRPRALDELGLGLALNELVHQWRQRCRNVHIVQNVNLNLAGIDELASITAYRVMQECLTNIAKHANAKKVVINVTQDERFVYLEIEDDGVGFDQNHTSQGFGLAGMKERIHGLLGEMIIESSLTKGTKVMVKLHKNKDLEEMV
jgi:two-component system sensor histidine kinase UhpB